jgi:hypothetical protein
MPGTTDIKQLPVELSKDIMQYLIDRDYWMLRFMGFSKEAADKLSKEKYNDE